MVRAISIAFWSSAPRRWVTKILSGPALPDTSASGRVPFQALLEFGDGDVHPGQYAGRQAVLLLEQGQEQMFGIYRRVVAAQGRSLGGFEGFPDFLGHFIEIHGLSP